MEQRPLGKTGLTVSALGYGCGNVGGLMVRGTHEQQVAAVRRALDAGVTYFDTAAMYGDGQSEINTGRVLDGARRLGPRQPRHQGAALGRPDLRDPAAAVRASIVASLQRLGRDSVDLLQLHNTIRASTDAQNPGLGGDDLAAAADAIQAVVREGLAAHAGFTGVGETAALHALAASGRFETMQSYFNAINPSAGHAGAGGGGAGHGRASSTPQRAAGPGRDRDPRPGRRRHDGAGGARAAGQPRPGRRARARQHYEFDLATRRQPRRPGPRARPGIRRWS